MVKPSDWTALQSRVDFVVDGRFAEPVILIPWMSGDKIYTPVEEGPDPARKIIKTTGIFVTPGSRLVGESGQATGGGNTQMLEQEVWVSITNDKIGDVTRWKKSDRVYFPNRDRFYNVSYVEDSATMRPNIHLIREHDIATGEGSPLGEATPTQRQALYFDIYGQKFYRATGLTNKDWVRL